MIYNVQRIIFLELCTILIYNLFIVYNIILYVELGNFLLEVLSLDTNISPTHDSEWVLCPRLSEVSSHPAASAYPQHVSLLSHYFISLTLAARN